MQKCPHCSSTSIKEKSIRTSVTGTRSQRYQCNSCDVWFSVKLTDPIPETKQHKDTRFVITACQNNATVNTEFLSTLVNYCKINSAKLLIVPILYRPDDHKEVVYNIPDDVVYQMVNTKLKIHDSLYVMGSFNFIPTTVNPLQGLESISKGDTLIVPSPQLRMKSLAVGAGHNPAILHTTGAISDPEYTNTKVGEKAKFNHVYSAVLVEIDSDQDFHIRVLNGDDDNRIIDLGIQYHPDTIKTTMVNPVALVTGDEHAMFADPSVESATYTGRNSIVRELSPKYVVRHDVLDANSISHHTRKDNVRNIGKMLFGTNKIVDELNITVDYIKRTSACGEFENVIVDSNHNNHLLQWFSSIDIKTEPWNAHFYHKYMAKIIESMEQTHVGISHIDPFEEYCKDVGLTNMKFLRSDESFNLGGVELGVHSHKGTNGSRGSINQFSNLPEKYVIGHSHCLIDGHSALTRSGWKPIHEILVGEFVLSYDSKTEQNVWVPNLQTHVMNYSGNIINIKTQHIVQSVTQNHMMSTKDGSYINVCELIVSGLPSMIPVAAVNGAKNPNTELCMLSDDDLKRIVAYCADGSSDKGKYIRFHLKKERKIERLKTLFSGCFTESAGGNIGGNGGRKFSIAQSSYSANMLMNYVGSVKRLPEFFRTLSIRQKELVIEELMFWDGTFDTGSNGRQWTTSKIEEFDLISSILVELGYRTSAYMKYPARRGCSAGYIVTWCSKKDFLYGCSAVSHQKERNALWGTQITKVESVRVSCLTTEFSNFWIRHDNSGKVSLTGNSPGVVAGAYQVGTSSRLKLDYTSGLSSWMHTHCLVYPNGKRQLINIINGKWKA